MVDSGKEVKLKKVIWRGYYMIGLKLEFTNGFTSREMKTDDNSSNASKELTEQEVDTTKIIRKVSVKVYDDNMMDGIRLFDENDNKILEIEPSRLGDWTTQDIPAGQSIIGMYGNSTGEQSGGSGTYITSLGFITWNR